MNISWINWVITNIDWTLIVFLCDSKIWDAVGQKSDCKATVTIEIITVSDELSRKIFDLSESGSIKIIIKILKIYFPKKNIQNWAKNLIGLVSCERKVKKADEDPKSSRFLTAIDEAIKNNRSP